MHVETRTESQAALQAVTVLLQVVQQGAQQFDFKEHLVKQLAVPTSLITQVVLRAARDLFKTIL